MQMKILAGDVGGTNTRLALFGLTGEQVKEEVSEVYPSGEYESLDSIVRKFIKTHDQPLKYACFGVAGPVIGGRCETPNLAWVIDGNRLANTLNLKTVELINDLEANAYGISVLGEEDFVVLNEGVYDPAGNAALIAAGTGLGEAGLYRDGRKYRPFPTEGGHADFAPRSDLEIELLRFLLGKYDRVSYERVVSGPGLHNIYTFLLETGRGSQPPWLAEMMSVDDPPAVISQAAIDGRSELCQMALDMFVSLYGSEAGNLALKFKATGGVFVGGGIAPKIISRLKEPDFMEAFVAKGRMRSLLEPIPVQVILNDQTALLGAAHLSTLRISGSS